jgi:hypothetical protein
MAASLDGFIARKDGRIDWLETSDEFTDYKHVRRWRNQMPHTLMPYLQSGNIRLVKDCQRACVGMMTDTKSTAGGNGRTARVRGIRAQGIVIESQKTGVPLEVPDYLLARHAQAVGNHPQHTSCLYQQLLLRRGVQKWLLFPAWNRSYFPLQSGT